MASYSACTSFLTHKEIKKEWFTIDAEGVVLGRLAARIALMLIGKDKAAYTPYMDCGSCVIVTNIEKIKVTGKKLDQNVFYWHTNYPGGIKEKKWRKIIEGNAPEFLLKKAVERMMPKESPLARKQMKSLYIYEGAEHPHVGQQPKVLENFIK